MHHKKGLHSLMLMETTRVTQIVIEIYVLWSRWPIRGHIFMMICWNVWYNQSHRGKKEFSSQSKLVISLGTLAIRHYLMGFRTPFFLESKNGLSTPDKTELEYFFATIHSPHVAQGSSVVWIMSFFSPDIIYTLILFGD